MPAEPPVGDRPSAGWARALGTSGVTGDAGERWPWDAGALPLGGPSSLAGVDGQPGHITHAGPHQSAWPWSWDTR